MRLHLRSLLEVTSILGEAVAELGRDAARKGLGWLLGVGEPMVDHGPDDETAAV